MLGTQERVAVLPEGLQCAEGPAEPLANQLAGSIRRFGPGDGFLVVADAPAEAANGDGEVGVFGHGVRGNAAGGFDGFLAPRAERSGNDGDAIEEIEGALLHVLAGNVFERLPAGEPAGAIANLNVAGDGANGGIRKVTDQFADGVGFDFGVRVDGDDNFGIRLGHGEIQSRGFSTIHLVDDAHARFMGKVCVEEFTRFVCRAVIDDDDLQVLQVREKDRSDGLHDDVFFIVRGNQDGNARGRVRHDGVVRTQFLDESEQTDDYGAPADEDDAENENDADEKTRPLKQRENKPVGARFEAFFGREGRHHFRACFSEQIRNRNELVPSGAQRVDDLGKSCHGLGAIAAAVVQENDIALVSLPEDAVDNFLCGDGLYAERALNQAFGQIQLPADFRACNVVELWMREGMISNFVAFGVLALENVRPLVGHVADYEEHTRHVFLLQNVQDLRRPFRIRAIVKGKNHFFIRCADLVNVVGERDGIVRFVREKIALRIVFEGTFAVLWCVSDVPDIAITFENQVRTRRKIREFLPGRRVGPGRIPDRPQRSVRRTEPPERCALHAQSLAGPELVVSGDGVQHPHLMYVAVLVVVRIVWIQGIAVEFYVSVRLLGVQ